MHFILKPVVELKPKLYATKSHSGSIILSETIKNVNVEHRCYYIASPNIYLRYNLILVLFASNVDVVGLAVLEPRSLNLMVTNIKLNCFKLYYNGAHICNLPWIA